MGQAKPFRATALIVEDDLMQREMLSLLLEESGYDVIQCESAEAAELVLEKSAGALCLMMTDVQLAGRMNGVELAHVAKDPQPEARRRRHLRPALDAGLAERREVLGQAMGAARRAPRGRDRAAVLRVDPAGRLSWSAAR
ncbi:CheY-like chemotaxis protein [Bradyrhizobium sp. GM0.4]